MEILHFGPIFLQISRKNIDLHWVKPYQEGCYFVIEMVYLIFLISKFLSYITLYIGMPWNKKCNGKTFYGVDRISIFIVEGHTYAKHRQVE